MLSGGRCHVDGGVLNNLPIDVMTRLAPGRIAAVDVSKEVALDLTAARMLGDADAGISGWRLLFRRLNPFRRREPPLLHIGDVLARTTEMAAVRIGRSIQERTPVALRLEPPVGGYRMLDFPSIDAIVEAGYAYASAHAAEWKARPARRLIGIGPGHGPARDLDRPDVSRHAPCMGCLAWSLPR